ncbi:MAG: M64 family metallopeptidase [Phycisphaerae bacterium]
MQRRRIFRTVSARVHLMRYLTVLLVVSASAAARAQKVPVYYDYVEDGRLAGGRLLIDLADPQDRATFGLGRSVEILPWAFTTIVDNGPTENRIDLVIVGDGYTESELDDYAADVDNVLSLFFAEEPLGAYSTYFNVHRVDVISNESGVDEPDNNIYRDTALDMTYNCSGIPRLLCVNVSKATAAAASAPDVDQILALANSTRYGGAGYAFANLATLAGNNSSAVELALHEFGHSFADLADEYEYGGPETYTGPEPSEANVSIYDAAEQLAQQLKWYRWMDLPNVDAFEGANYSYFGIYRPTFNSKMRNLGPPFEEVNVEQFVRFTYESVSPIDGATPSSAPPLFACEEFFVEPLAPADHGLDIQWSVDGVDVPGADANTFVAYTPALDPGVHDVAVTVTDNTARVRDESIRSNLMTGSRQWQIEVLGVPDECVCQPAWPMLPDPLLADMGHGTKNRYVSFVGGDPGRTQAVQVTFVSLPGYEYAEGRSMWVREPAEMVECSGCDGHVPPFWWGATLGCESDAFWGDWSVYPAVDLYNDAIVPGAVYDVKVIDQSCDPADPTQFAEPLTVQTSGAGDVVGFSFLPDLLVWDAPQGIVDFVDIGAVVEKFKNIPGAARKARADLVNSDPTQPLPDRSVDFVDISFAVDAFRGVITSPPGPPVDDPCQ